MPLGVSESTIITVKLARIFCIYHMIVLPKQLEIVGTISLISSLNIRRGTVSTMLHVLAYVCV